MLMQILEFVKHDEGGPGLTNNTLALLLSHPEDLAGDSLWTWLSLEGCDKLSDSAMKSVARLPNLYSLDLSRSMIATKGVGAYFSIASWLLFEHLDGANTPLEQLWLNYCPRVDDRTLLKVCGASFGHQLGLLSLRACPKLSPKRLVPLQDLSQLKALDLSYSCNLQINDASLSFLSQLPNLESLLLDGSQHLTGKFLAFLTTSSLTTLSLGNCPRLMSQKDVPELISKYASLTKLNLDHCQSLNSSCLKALHPLSRLTSLSLVCCPYLQVSALSRLLDYLSSLRSLSITPPFIGVSASSSQARQRRDRFYGRQHNTTSKEEPKNESEPCFIDTLPTSLCTLAFYPPSYEHLVHHLRYPHDAAFGSIARHTTTTKKPPSLTDEQLATFPELLQECEQLHTLQFISQEGITTTGITALTELQSLRCLTFVDCPQITLHALVLFSHLDKVTLLSANEALATNKNEWVDSAPLLLPALDASQPPHLLHSC
ncbi:hypothetical protein QOT17_015874 [Balamuthia mandrillaris]